MATVNINRNVADQFNRYTMPKLISKIEGKGNGVKTVIANMSEVAKSLARPPSYPTKYFGCELGAQTQFDNKNERYIINGSHDASKLQDLLDGFIKKFVLCPTCDNPETNLAIQARRGVILQRCLACGHVGNIDMRHKVTTFILKNPPEQDINAMTPCKKEKKVSKKSSATPTTAGGKDSSAKDCVDGTTSSPEHASNDTYEDDWCDDTSAEAVAARQQSLSSAAKNITISDDVDKPISQRINLFYVFVKLRTDSVINLKVEKEIICESERLEITEKAPLILAELLFNDQILTQLKKYRNLLLRFTNNNDKSQKYLLGGIEQLIGNVHTSLIPKVAHIFKALYDLDIVSEEILIDWHNKESKKYVKGDICKEIHKVADPFIKWLSEAEEESDSEDEDNESQIVYSHTEKVGSTIQNDKKDDVAEDKKVEADDFDIDAI